MTQRDGPGIEAPTRAAPSAARRTRRRGGSLGAGMTQWKGAKKAAEQPHAEDPTLVAPKADSGRTHRAARDEAERLEVRAQKLRETKLQIARQDEERRRLEQERAEALRARAAARAAAVQDAADASASPAAAEGTGRTAAEAAAPGAVHEAPSARAPDTAAAPADSLTADSAPTVPKPAPTPDVAPAAPPAAPEATRADQASKPNGKAAQPAVPRRASASEPRAAVGTPPSATPPPDAEEKAPTRKPPRRPGSGRGAREGKTRGGRMSSRELIKNVDSEARQDSLAKFRRRKDRERRARQRAFGGETQRIRVHRDVQIPDAITVQDLALRMAEPGSEVVRKLFSLGQITTINDVLDGDTAELIVREFGHRPQRVSASDIEIGLEGEDDSPENLRPRAPVVTVMGHVDHGKTSLLDIIRKSDIAAGEAGAITQHIGASHVETSHGPITFLDTPGHAAFSSMRARGASITDLVVLAVAANDGLMPQTEEAIDHARAAGVPMVVAINKIDIEDANPDRVRDDLLRKEVIVEDRGGETLDVEVSAKTGAGIDELLETVILQASLLDLRSNPERSAEGAVVEARLDRGRGSVATVLVQRGTLRKADIFVIGSHWGRARTLRDERGSVLKKAGPSIPVEVDGLSGTPEAGDRFVVVESEARAREIAEYRSENARKTKIAPLRRRTLDTFGQSDSQQDLAVVVKADVHGSSEAIVEALSKIGNEDVRVHVVHAGVGAISESDITLASTSGAHVLGFNVRPNAQAKLAAAKFGVDISFHSIIYELLDEIRRLASGLLTPEVRETELGRAEVLEIFRVSKIGAVAGCRITSGVARKNARARVLRDGVVLYTGALATLKRFKEDAAEVNSGNECGMSFRNHQDIRQGDVIELFQTEEITRSL